MRGGDIMLSQQAAQKRKQKGDSLLQDQGCATVAPGMIRLIVKEVAERAGITNAKELSVKAGLYYRTCYLLWHGKTRRIDLDTIEKLCTLLEVRPAQLLEFEPDPSVLPSPPQKKPARGKK
jgi:DNA-binding Xre family transcriptional regulator